MNLLEQFQELLDKSVTIIRDYVNNNHDEMVYIKLPHFNYETEKGIVFPNELRFYTDNNSYIIAINESCEFLDMDGYTVSIDEVVENESCVLKILKIADWMNIQKNH